jgi:cyclic beta-1,2-glucan synthetase
MYRAAIEGLLGLRRHGSTFTLTPSIPAMWPSFSIDWRVGEKTRYRISVLNPDHRSRGTRVAALDGVEVDPNAIPLVDDGGVHEVLIELGAAVRAESHPAPVGR